MSYLYPLHVQTVEIVIIMSCITSYKKSHINHESFIVVSLDVLVGALDDRWPIHNQWDRGWGVTFPLSDTPRFGGCVVCVVCRPRHRQSIRCLRGDQSKINTYTVEIRHNHILYDVYYYSIGKTWINGNVHHLWTVCSGGG